MLHSALPEIDSISKDFSFYFYEYETAINMPPGQPLNCAGKTLAVIFISGGCVRFFYDLKRVMGGPPWMMVLFTLSIRAKHLSHKGFNCF
jgi:hypothetical protein